MDHSPSMQNFVTEFMPLVDEIISLETPERIIHSIIKQLVNKMECKTCAVVEINPDTEYLEIINFHNLSWTFCKDYRKRIISPVIRELLWEEKSIYIPDTKKTKSLADELKLEHDFISCLVVPLETQHKPMGFLYVDSDEEDHFKGAHQFTVQFYAKMISIIMLIDHLSQRLNLLEVNDPHSGAMRYEHFYPRLEEIFERSLRLKENLALIIVDIEEYGTIINTYGADVAYELLKELVAFLKSRLRPYDLIARFGADEFLIVLPATGHEEAMRVAQKLNSSLTKRTFTYKKIKIDIQSGLAVFPVNSKHLDGLIKVTKNFLLEAKRQAPNTKIYSNHEFYE
jgi:diguanylate cyclase (GGDEF)-like protein